MPLSHKSIDAASSAVSLLTAVVGFATSPGLSSGARLFGQSASILKKTVADTSPPGLVDQLGRDLAEKLAHQPADRQLVVAQMIEQSVPDEEAFVSGALSAARVMAQMQKVLAGKAASNPAMSEFGDPVNLALFEDCVTPVIEDLLSSPGFVGTLAPGIARQTLDRLESIAEGQTEQTAKLGDLQSGQDDLRAGLAEQKALLAQLLERSGGAGGLLSQPEALGRDDLQTLAGLFGGDPDCSPSELMQFIRSKAEEYQEFRRQTGAIDDRLTQLATLKASADEAAAALDFEGVEEYLARIDDVQTEIAAETKEVRARNALLRGEVEQAFHLLCAAADSFGGSDPLGPARRMFFTSVPVLNEHWERFGGDSPAFSVEMARGALTQDLAERDPLLWDMGRHALGASLAFLGVGTGGEAGRVFLEEAVEELTDVRDALLGLELEEGDLAAGFKSGFLTDLGYALRYLGQGTKGPEGEAYLHRAIETYKQGLSFGSAVASPGAYCATLHINIGNAYMDLAERGTGQALVAHRREALENYRKALDYTRAGKVEPFETARAAKNLASALLHISRSADAGEAPGMLERSVVLFEEAIGIWQREDFPVQTLGALQGLAFSQALLVNHTDDPAQEMQLITAAVTNCDAAIDICRRIGDPASEEALRGMRRDFVKTRDSETG
ncbi:hypothetical protein [uncultured Roseobacter sp.]|uniref:hypothetical protein n=1 Tax=uncultured Roseobacter sp. TaxID=114847 RepID=UPI0026217E2B|nr:hypothetical protein [uncultured Roseobacter sp.]